MAAVPVAAAAVAHTTTGTHAAGAPPSVLHLLSCPASPFKPPVGKDVRGGKGAISLLERTAAMQEGGAHINIQEACNDTAQNSTATQATTQPSSDIASHQATTRAKDPCVS